MKKFFCYTLGFILLTEYTWSDELRTPKREEDLDYFEQELYNREEVEKRKDILELEHDILVDKSEDTGISDLYHITEKDRFRHNLVLHYNIFQEYLGFEYAFSRNVDIFWPELFVSYAKTNFSSISNNPSGATNANPDAEINHPRARNTEEILMMLGAGPTYRFKFPEALNPWQIQHLFQMVNVSLLYISLKDSLRSETYQGPGFRASYGLHKRLSVRNHLGFRMNYHLGVVKRAETIRDVSSDDRKLLLNWYSLALDYAYYF
jgi:hypothetical protein